jgi:23S rRNA (cytosine1962-C5)-methyltransferase
VELIAPGWDDYELIDSGNEMRLERIGPHVISRQSAQALWRPSLSSDEWDEELSAGHYRHDQGPGRWDMKKPVPDTWQIAFNEIRLKIKLTPFGHIGLFGEQQCQWPWITDQLKGLKKPRVMNLFAYTGGATLAAACGGGHVTHVDAVKGIVGWARENAQLSGLADANVRWIVDDALKYCRREQRRGSQYEALILDPPTFGRGPQGTVWKIEKHLVELLEVGEQLLSDNPRFVLLTAHTPGVTAAVLRNILGPLVRSRGGALQSGDMIQTSRQGDNVLPSGVYCRWEAE